MVSTLLITGCAGFIGYHCAARWLAAGGRVIGFDNLNDYYDPALKRARLALLKQEDDFTFVQGDLADKAALHALFAVHKPDAVLHLAAQVGVRYSLIQPQAYIDANVTGFLNILEAVRTFGAQHLLYASSSSVYGANTAMPFNESDAVDHPVSLYAATKRSNELMAHTYSHLFGIPTTGLRFFTVYGPWGRPDMAPFAFTKAILAGEPILVFNEGRMRRDFTYISDIVDGIMAVIPLAPKPNADWRSAPADPSSSYAPYRLYNIGHNEPTGLLDFIAVLEQALGRKAVLKMMPMQPGDVVETYASVEALEQLTGYTPQVSIDKGIPLFTSWYRSYYSI
ncbi:NAD-dependent epimerase [Paenibacillus sp. R14(2021)]|uniref:NAD-dependent epimerase n=1 Tax=Paenibacillus sp. R14(2021) TaxID=2859228 RepID=UPI00215812B1|nr:NAD-dependent epimerase [Paenibacillus sp. R14(2021)]